MAKISKPPRDRNCDWPGHTRVGPAMGPQERIAEILAAGLMRLVAQKSSPISTDTGDSSLDFSATESGHPALGERGISDG